MKEMLYFLILLPFGVLLFAFIFARCSTITAPPADTLEPIRRPLQKEAGPLEKAALPQNGPHVTRYFTEADRYTPGYKFPGTRIMGTIRTSEYLAGTILLLPEKQPFRGTIIVLHGYSAYSAYNLPAYYKIAEQGWALLAVDLPGHGYSGGYSGEIGDFSQYGKYLLDLISWTETQKGYHLPKPVILLGHSTGCSAILESLWQASPDIDSAVLLSPLLYKKNLASMRCCLSCLKPFMYSGPVFYKKEGYLSFDAYPFSWIEKLTAWQQKLAGKPDISLPMLVLQGDNDQSLKWQKNMTFVQNHFPNADIRILPGRGHVLLNHKEAEDESVALINVFLNRRSTEE